MSGFTKEEAKQYYGLRGTFKKSLNSTWLDKSESLATFKIEYGAQFKVLIGSLEDEAGKVKLLVEIDHKDALNGIIYKEMDKASVEKHLDFPGRGLGFHEK